MTLKDWLRTLKNKDKRTVVVSNYGNSKHLYEGNAKDLYQSENELLDRDVSESFVDIVDSNRVFFVVLTR